MTPPCALPGLRGHEPGALTMKPADHLADSDPSVLPSLHAFVHSPELDKPGYPQASPFKTGRAGRARAIADSMDLLSGDDVEEVHPRAATFDELSAFHTTRYLKELESAGRSGAATPAGLDMGFGTPDCPIFGAMYDYPALAAGATLTAARLVASGRYRSAFNPSGGFHHAAPERAAGFCFVNDIVLACMELASAGKRVLFLDLDVHHCDGVQDAFYRRSDVMTVSIHESGRSLFPGTGFETEIGEGPGEGYSVNVPLPVGTYDDAYLLAFRRVAVPLISAYDPDVIVVELGMDGLAGDPLAHLHLTNNAYADCMEALMRMGRPVVATGGGGYNPEHTARGWALMWSILCGRGSASDLSFGLGGVMLGTSEWHGGLRDRMLISDGGRRETVDSEVERVVSAVRRTVFPLHGLSPDE
ncbi:MAG: acetoin utilization protein AcuC [Lentisphaerae bacterium]|nr:acetoin utilization protein AcuC [Lentisphaerota bacterium]